MANGWYIWSLKSSLTLLLLGVFFSCNNTKKTLPNIKDYQLKSGDIVCRLGGGFFSNYFRKYASKEKKYSHIGIVEVKNDTVFIIHTEASELTGVGCVKKESINCFLENILVFDFYRVQVNRNIRKKIVVKAKEYYNKKVPFDLDFNSFNNEKMYCTELVANVLNRAFDSIVIVPTLKLGAKKMYGLDDIYKNKLVNKLAIIK